MTAPVPFPQPPGRALTEWRRELAPFRPRRLWLAHLLLHRVECLVRVARTRPLDPFAAALLRQLASGTPPDRLALDRDLLARWMDELTAGGLVEEGGRRLTERGRSALQSSACQVHAEERRVFTFVEGEAPGERPRFAALQGPAVPLTPPAGWRFDPAELTACVRQSEAWKTRHGFPTDVEAVLAPAAAEGGGAADWRRVMLDRAEELLLVFPDGGGEGAGRPGFAVRPEDWALQAGAPTLTLAPARDDLLPGVGAEPAEDVWRAAWREWGRRRGLAPAGADACRVEPADDRVRVTVPPGDAARLGGERGDAWLTAGAGRTRVAAPLEIVDEKSVADVGGPPSRPPPAGGA